MVNNFITMVMRAKAVMGIVILIAMLFSSIGVGFSSTNAGNFAKNSTVMRDLNNGLVAYYSFDEGSGNVLHDVSGHGNEGTIYGATWVDGVRGKALKFSGENSYVNCGTTLTGTVLRSVTVAAFINVNRFPQSGDPDQVDVYARDTIFYDGSDGEFNLFIRENRTVAFSIKMSDYSWYGTFSTTKITADMWYQVTGIYDGINNTISIFVNGQLENTKTVPKISLYNPSGDYYPTIGAYSGISDNHRNYLNGIIDDLRIYNRALSAEEIKALYYQYVPKAPRNLQADMGRKWIHLHWDTPDNANSVGLSGYNIYRSEDGINYEKIGESVETNYNDTSVVEGRTYYYYVVGKNANGVEGIKSENLTVNFVLPPTAPQNLSVEYRDGKVILSWYKPKDNGGAGIDAYVIYRSEDGANYKKIGVASLDTTTYYDENVENGKTYYYYLTATNRVGESEKSNIVKITTPNPFPWLWIILGLIILAVIIAAVLLMVKRERETKKHFQKNSYHSRH